METDWFAISAVCQDTRGLREDGIYQSMMAAKRDFQSAFELIEDEGIYLIFDSKDE